MSRINLKSGEEWRIQVDFSQELSFRVISGIAEVFGTELAINVDYRLRGAQLAIYCYEPCDILFQGTCQSQQISTTSPVPQYLALHFALQNARSSGKLPRVLVLGSRDLGKSSLCRTLAAYAVKMDESPMLVSLDPASGTYSVPGTISACVVNDIFDIETGYGTTVVTGAAAFHPVQPAVLYYGYSNVFVNPRFYSLCLKTLGEVVNKRLEADQDVRHAGVLVDGGRYGADNMDVINDVISNFNIDTVVVIGNKDLELKLPQNLNVILFDDTGAVPKDGAFMRNLQQTQIKQYFYGERKTVLSPFTLTSVDYSRMAVFKIVESNKIEEKPSEKGPLRVDVSSVLPIGEGIEDDPLMEEKKEEQDAPEPQLVPIVKDGPIAEKIPTESSSLQNAIVAFVHASRDLDPEHVALAGVYCFGHVSDANDQRKKMRVLLPSQGGLPNAAAVIGEFRFLD